MDGTEYLWNLLLMIVPILVMVSIGVLALAVVLGYIVWNIKTLGWHYLITQWRVVVFLSFYVYIYIFVFAFQIELIIQKNSQYQAYADFLDCRLFQTFDANLVCELQQFVNYPLWVIVVFNASAQGIGVFLIFGTTLQVYKVRNIWN